MEGGESVAGQPGHPRRGDLAAPSWLVAQAHTGRDPFPSTVTSGPERDPPLPPGLRSNQVGVRGRVLVARRALGARSLQCAGLAARWQRHGHEAGWGWCFLAGTL